MFSFKTLVLSILLCTVPSLPIYSAESTKTCPTVPFAFPFTYDDVVRLLEAIETGEVDELCSPEEGEKICRFLALLARAGAIADTDEEKEQLERDIEKLLYGDPYSLIWTPFNGQREFLPCRSWIKKLWDEGREFVYEHKTGLIIGTAILLAGGAIVYAVTAGAAAAVSEGCASYEEPARPTSPPPAPSLPEPVARPSFQEVVQERLSSFKEELQEEELYAVRIEDHPQGSLAKKITSLLAHETFDAIAELGAIIPQFRDEVVHTSSLVADKIEQVLGISLFNPETLPANGWLKLPSQINATENYTQLVAQGHEKLDELFSSSFAELYTPEAKAKDPFNEFYLGILPPPNTLLGGVSSARKILQAGQGTALLAEELGFTAREIVQLEKSGTLEVAVEDAFGNLVKNPANLQSWEKFGRAKEFLKSYQGKTFSSELEIRELIRQSGVETFPRPKGIPENYKIRLTDKSAGIKYVHPKDEGTYIRVMPGKPHSPFPHQREPYVMQMRCGKALDKYGNITSSNAPEAHIPINEFNYIKN